MSKLDLDKKYLDAIKYNKENQEKIGYEPGFLWELLGFNYCVDINSQTFLDKLMNWQERNGLKPDGKIGPTTFRHMIMTTMNDKDKAIYDVFLAVQKYESGGRYDKLNLDGEFEGHFDAIYKGRGQPPHWASGKAHLGLSAFSIQWNQDVGTLGELLTEMAKQNSTKFKVIVGPTWQELLAVTNRAGPRASEIIKFTKTYPIRSNRVQKVPINDGGDVMRVDLWRKPWTDVFRKLGRDPEFQKVQRQVAFDMYLRRFIPYLEQHKLYSVKSVATAFNRSVHFGQGRVESLFNQFLTPANKRLPQIEYETKVLKGVAKKYHRAKDLLEDDDFSFEKWNGFEVLR